jgi:hypothetical protein
MADHTPTPIEQLTSSELDSYLTAARILVHAERKHGILNKPVLMTGLIDLGVDLEAQKDERNRIAREASTAAKAACQS